MIILIVFLLFVLFICSIFESSFSNINIIRIKHLMEKKNDKAKIIYNLYQNYSDVITTILVINCIASVMVSSVTVYYFSNLYGDKCIGIVTIILTIVILLFTEIVPKILGREYSEYFALKIGWVLKYLVYIFTPVNKIISLFDRRVKNNQKVTATKEELVEIVKTIKDEGVIEEKESAFIQKAVLLKKLKVQNVMIDKSDVTYLYDTDSSSKVRECVFKDKHDRIPIINKNNKVVGILYEVDLLDEILNAGTISIKNNMKEAICVSRNMSLASSLELLQLARAHFAVVTDRDKNFIGIITLEDIIDELMKS